MVYLHSYPSTVSPQSLAINGRLAITEGTDISIENNQVDIPESSNKKLFIEKKVKKQSSKVHEPISSTNSLNENTPNKETSQSSKEIKVFFIFIFLLKFTN